MSAARTCSASTRRSEMPWRTFARPAVIVAESLRRMPEPPFPGVRRSTRTADAVAAAIARVPRRRLPRRPHRAGSANSQRVTFARALAAITEIQRRAGSRSGGKRQDVDRARTRSRGRGPDGGGDRTLGVAGPVGSLRRAHRRGPCRPVARAVEPQDLPLPAGLVIVDESHRFRHPYIRRYGNLARALCVAPGSCSRATPAVNRLADVAHQLLLFARDDCLAGAGVPSLLEALERNEAPPALADLVITGATAPGRPAILERAVDAGEAEEQEAREILESLEALRLSPSRPSRRSSLVFSRRRSPRAGPRWSLRWAVIATCCCNADDASRSGLRLGRRELAALLGPDAAQTVLWPLMENVGAGSDLVGEDLPAARATHRVRSGSGTPTRSSRGSPHCSTMAPSRSSSAGRAQPSTCCGAPWSRPRVWRGSRAPAAGIGPLRLARRDVLRWFGPRATEHPLAPRILIATDVASEGLDLQRAQRVVHYDLPWTAVRLDQRAGRAVRLGSTHAGVDIVTLLPPAIVESRLRLLARLAWKRPLPSRLGLGHAPEPVWQWRNRLASRFIAPPRTGAAIVDGGSGGRPCLGGAACR